MASSLLTSPVSTFMEYNTQRKWQTHTDTQKVMPFYMYSMSYFLLHPFSLYMVFQKKRESHIVYVYSMWRYGKWELMPLMDTQ